MYTRKNVNYESFGLIFESCGQESFGGVDAVEYKRYFFRVYGHSWLIKGC